MFDKPNAELQVKMPLSIFVSQCAAQSSLLQRNINVCSAWGLTLSALKRRMLNIKEGKELYLKKSAKSVNQQDSGKKSL